MSSPSIDAPQIQRYLEQGALQQAAEALKLGLKQDPDNPELWILQARLARAAHDIPLALGAYEQALSLAPDRAAWHTELAFLLRAQSDPRARRHFEAARAFAPEQLEYSLNLIRDYLQTGELHDAFVYLSDCLKQNPESAQLFVLLGQALRYSGQSEDAEKALQQSLLLVPSHMDALLALLQLYDARADYVAGQSVLMRVSPAFIQEQSPEVQSYYHHLKACIHYAQGDFIAARTAWRSSLNVQFNLLAFWGFNLALPPVFQEPEELEQWEEALQQSLEILSQHDAQWPLSQLPLCPAWHLPLTQRTESVRRLGQILGQNAAPLEFKPCVDLLVLLKDWDAPQALDLAQALLTLERDDFQLRVGYLYGPLPSVLEPYAERCLQLPDYLPALRERVRALQSETVLYAQLNASLYALALERAAPRQIWLACGGEKSGVPSMDYVLSVAEPLEDGPEINLNLPVAPVFVQVQPADRAERADWNLPRLGRLYCVVADLQDWDFALDEQLDQIFQRDHKAFIWGFQRPQSQIHLALKRRYASRFPSRHKRIRFVHVPLAQRPTFLSLMDVVLEAPHAGELWHCAQAWAQGAAVVCVDGKTPRARQGVLLANLLELEASAPEQLGEKAVLAARGAERDMLMASADTDFAKVLRTHSQRAAAALIAKLKEMNPSP